MRTPVARTTTHTHELVLDCYRSPQLLRSLSDHTIPLPEGVERLLRAALGYESYSISGTETVSPDELRRATLLFVKRVVLVDGGDHYRALGVRRDASAEQIDANYRALVALLHSDEDEPTSALCRHVMRVSKAYSIVGESASRRIYDRSYDSAKDADDFDVPVEAVVDEILSNGRRPLPAVDGTAQREDVARWEGVPGGQLTAQQWKSENPTYDDFDEFEEFDDFDKHIDAGETPEPTKKPSRFARVPDRVLVGVSLLALGVIVLAVPVLIARYSMPTFIARMTPTVNPTASIESETLSDSVSQLDWLDDPNNALTALAGMGATLDAVEPTEVNKTPAVAHPSSEEEVSVVYSSKPFTFDEHFGTVRENHAPQKAEVTARVPQPPTKLAQSVPSPKTVASAPAEKVELAPVPNKKVEPSPTPEKSSSNVVPITMPKSLNADAVTLDTKAPSLFLAPAMPMDHVSQTVANEELPTQPPQQEAKTPVVAVAPQMSVSVAPAELLIPRKELSRLVSRFEGAYQDGNIIDFMELFSDGATSNDRVDKIGIREDYEQLFNSTVVRQFLVKDLNWRYEDERAVGTGDFTVRIKPRWKNRDEVFTGKIELRVERAGDELHISGMYHDYK